MQRQCIRQSPEMTWQYRYCAKFPHCSCSTEYDSIQQRPFDMWKCYFWKNRPSFCSHKCCCFFLIRSNRLQYWKQFTINKWKCYKYSRQNDSRNSKYNLDICFLQIRVKNALFSKYKKIDQTCNDWWNRDWYIDQSRQKFFPLKLKSRHCPGCT